jgi:hypothetical protein
VNLCFMAHILMLFCLDSDDDIVMPAGPPPAQANDEDEDSDDDIPMPEGPPPGQAFPQGTLIDPLVYFS